MPDNVDWGFIQGNEQTRNDGYVPVDANGNPIGHSGVTVATGIDLGQMNQQDLNALGLPDDLNQTLSPYLGLTGNAALTYLQNNPLHLDGPSVATLDGSYQTHAFDTVEDLYDADRDPGITPFADLSGTAQTVIMDVAWQYGNDLAHATPHFWGNVVRGEWADAVDELRNFGDAFGPRRNAEADIMQQAIDDGQLPPVDPHGGGS
jgi:hypothetical protein